LEAVFILLEPLSPSRRIFIGSHSLPPLWFAVSVLHELGCTADLSMAVARRERGRGKGEKEEGERDELAADVWGPLVSGSDRR
jgi:hypothetical protein